MIRVAPFVFLVAVALAQTGATTWPDRGPYQSAYRSWRAADPDLERDTSAANPAMGARADKVAAEAAKYFSVRKSYLDQLQAGIDRRAAAIEAIPLLAPIDAKPAAYLATQTNLINRSIDSIANDPDRAIQRLRAALDRERSALTALSAALVETQHSYDQAQTAAMSTEQSRGKIAEDYQSLAASLKKTSLQTEQTGNLWAEYYRALSDGLRGVPPRDLGPVSAVTTNTPIDTPATPEPTTAPSPVPNTLPSPAPSPSADTSVHPAVDPLINPAPTPVPASARETVPTAAPATKSHSITPLPLSRYIGSWVYPKFGAEYHGMEPSSVDMVVSENNGQAKGKLEVWFKVPPNSKTEPAVRFDFEGPLQATRNQSFPLITSNGAKGTLELIPGNVYNMIQVRFSTEDKPATVRQADFLVIKK